MSWITSASSIESRISALLCIWLAGLLLLFVLLTLHWPMVGDAVLMHYVVFLMQHGMKPYRDIVDMNLPGSYLLDALEMCLLGRGALAWRFYDFGLITGAAASLGVILRRQGRLPVILAAVLFALIHGSDGILMTGERDFAGSVLLLAAVACLFTAQCDGRRLRRGVLFGGSGVLIGAACCIKPTFLILAIFLIAWATWVRHKAEMSRGALLLPLLAGVLLPVLGCAIFLSLEASSAALLGEFRGLIPYHASIDSRSLSYLFENCLSPLAGMFSIWLVAVWLMREREADSERVALALCALGGLFSYLLQGKGFWYQRYPLLAFALPLFIKDFSELLRTRRWPRWIGVIGLSMGVLVASQCSARVMRIDRYEPPPPLLRDLESVNRPSVLSGHVQCMDTFGGCIDALYDGQIVQSTGFLYDCYIMGGRGEDKDGLIVADLRSHFWQELSRNPPRVIVETDSVCYEPERTFDKYEHWPEFKSYLAAKYVLLKQSGPQAPVHYWSRPLVPYGYRIYLRRTDLARPR